MLGIEDGVCSDGELPVVRAWSRGRRARKGAGSVPHTGVEDGVRGEPPVVRARVLGVEDCVRGE